jgi:hypothetical protein
MSGDRATGPVDAPQALAGLAVPQRIPAKTWLAPAGSRTAASPGDENAPAGAGGGRNAPAGADRQGRGRSCARTSPEMRSGSHHDDWAATPQAALSH